MQLESRVSEEGIVNVKLSGRMDIQGAQSIDAKFTAITATQKALVLVDMTEVPFLASIGMRTLIAGKMATAPVPPAALLNGGLMRLGMPASNFIMAREMASVAFPNSLEFLEEAVLTPDGGASAPRD